VHGKRRSKATEYGIRLREKQKVKRYYGILERQFRRYYHEAERMKGDTGLNLLKILESRLDNVVYRLGFALSISHARQVVRHGHILVNGKKADIPGMVLKPGDVISPASNEKSTRLVSAVFEANTKPLPSWLEISQSPLSGKLIAEPTRDEIPIPIEESLIVEFASR